MPAPRAKNQAARNASGTLRARPNAAAPSCAASTVAKAHAAHATERRIKGSFLITFYGRAAGRRLRFLEGENENDYENEERESFAQCARLRPARPGLRSGKEVTYLNRRSLGAEGGKRIDFGGATRGEQGRGETRSGHRERRGEVDEHVERRDVVEERAETAAGGEREPGAGGEAGERQPQAVAQDAAKDIFRRGAERGAAAMASSSDCACASVRPGASSTQTWWRRCERSLGM